MDGDMGSSED
jgi:hypothetical protein